MKKIFTSVYTQASILYVILGILPSAINFLLLPIYLEYLAVVDYGMLVLINLYTGLFSVFACFQLNIAANVQYFSKGIDDKESYRNGVLVAAFVLSILMLGLFTSLGQLFFSFYETELDFYPLGFVSLLSATGMLWHTMLFTFLKNEYRIKEFGIFTIVLTILGIALQAYFIIELAWGLSGIIYGIFLSQILILPFSLFYFRKWIRVQLANLKMLWKNGLLALKFSIPFLPTILLHWAQTLGDRIILERFISLEKIGQYAIILVLIAFPQMLVNAAMNALKPKLLQLLNDERHTLINKVEYVYANLMVLALMMMFLFGTHLNWLTDNPKYIEVDQYLFIGILSILPNSLLYMHHLKLMANEKTGAISRFSFYGVLVQVILLFLLVPTMGIYGALISFGAGGLLTYGLNAKKVYSFKNYPLGRVLQPALIMVIAIAIGYGLVHFMNFHLRFASEIITILTILLIVVLTRKELADIFSFLNSSKPN